MKSLFRPTRAQLNAYLQRCLDATFTYASVGCSNGPTTNFPQGFVIDHREAWLGHGEAVFERACRALENWQQTDLGWVEPAWPKAAFEVGSIVGTLARSCGLWWTNPCRIVYIIDERNSATASTPHAAAPRSKQRFGFAYGTIADHVECGEERFLLEWDHKNDAVRYEIQAFSRPAHWTTRVGYPLVRRVQKAFGRDSVAKMQRLCNTGQSENNFDRQTSSDKSRLMASSSTD